jgi:hypothetical protein
MERLSARGAVGEPVERGVGLDKEERLTVPARVYSPPQAALATLETRTSSKRSSPPCGASLISSALIARLMASANADGRIEGNLKLWPANVDRLRHFGGLFCCGILLDKEEEGDACVRQY